MSVPCGTWSETESRTSRVGGRVYGRVGLGGAVVRFVAVPYISCRSSSRALGVRACAVPRARLALKTVLKAASSEQARAREPQSKRRHMSNHQKKAHGLARGREAKAQGQGSSPGPARVLLLCLLHLLGFIPRSDRRCGNSHGFQVRRRAPRPLPLRLLPIAILCLPALEEI